MKQYFILIFLVTFGCIDSEDRKDPVIDKTEDVRSEKQLVMDRTLAEKLAQLPLDCIQIEYPNKLDHVIGSKEDLAEPKALHPAFYGCFDWHSSVHGHWSLVRLLKQFPDLTSASEIRKRLLENISKESITQEVTYFSESRHKSSERTYGWAWLLKLAEELHTWKDEDARILEQNLQPLTDLIVNYYQEFLPKLTKPIRVGEHQNTAFALVFAYDYAKTVNNQELLTQIKSVAIKFFEKDIECPISYEPGGFDFLSPCLEEIHIMSKVYSEQEFFAWLEQFLPQLINPDFELEPGSVSDREDGKLVHLDGVNFSRAWVLYDLANRFNKLKHLEQVATRHFNYSFENILDGDSYMGSHWLGSFALYALDQRDTIAK